MTWTQVLAPTGTGMLNDASSGSITPSAVGDMLFLAIGNGSNSTIVVNSVSSSNATWTQLGTNTDSLGRFTTSVFLGTSTSTSAGALTLTWSGTAPGVILITCSEFHSTVGAWSVDTSANLNNTGGTATWPTLTPTGVNELYVGYALDTGTSSNGTTSGYTYLSTNGGNSFAFNPAVSAASHPVWGDSGDVVGQMYLVQEANLVNNFEEGTSGTTISTSNTAGTGEMAFDSVQIGSSATLTFDNTQSAHGGLAAKITTPATATFSHFFWGTKLGSGQTQVFFRAYFYFPTLPPSGTRLFSLWNTTSGSTLEDAVIVNSSGQLTWVNAATGTLTTVLPTSQWCRIEGFLTTGSTNNISISLYESMDSTTATETQTASHSGYGTIGSVGAGVSNSVASVTMWVDDFEASPDAAIGPVTGIVAFDAAGPSGGVAQSVGSPATSPLTWSHTAASGAALVVWICADSISQATASLTVTYGSSSLTQIAAIDASSVGANNGFLACYGLANAGNGSAQTVSVFWSTSGVNPDVVDACSVSYTGAGSAFATAFGTPASNDSSTSNYTISLSTASSASRVAAGNANGGSGTGTGLTGGILRKAGGANSGGFCGQMMAGDAAGNGSTVSLTFTGGGGTTTANIAVEVLPATPGTTASAGLATGAGAAVQPGIGNLYATAAQALSGGAGSWTNTGNADGAPDSAYATWVVP